MTVSKKTKKASQKDSNLSSRRELLREIGKNHLKKKFGKLTDNRSRGLRFWEIGGKVLKHYVHTDARSKSFITSLTKSTVISIQNENATIICINYFGGLGNVFTIYFFQPELIMKHYIKANIKPKRGDDEWHITIFDDDEHMIFIRRDADDIVIPADTNNYFIRFKMTDGEYEQLLALLPENKKSITQVKTTLKVRVRGEKGQEEFSITSAVVIALLSVLTNSNKPLTIEEILTGMIGYGVLTRASNEKTSIKRALNKMVKTGGITAIKVKGQPISYTLSDDIKIDVVL